MLSKRFMKNIMGNTISSATTCSNSISTITKSLTDHPPSSYSVKIENLTRLNDEKYQSRRFTVGGYDWRLIIYPKGNNEDNGSGFISMYVEKVDSTSEVFAYVKFFVYNKKEQKYFTIQDTEVKRFNALRMVWGFSQVLPLDLFNYPKSEYLFEGKECEFGVEVMVVPPLTNWEVVSFNEKFSNPIFSWSLKNFSASKSHVFVTKSFSFGAGKKWVLKLYPNGSSKAVSNWLSVYMHLADSETLSNDEKIYVHADIRVLDPRGHYLHTTHELKCWYKNSGQGWGWDQFVSKTVLGQSYLDKDILTLEVELKAISATKYSHPLST